MRRDVPTGVAGLAGVALNLAAVVAVQPMPHAYTPGGLDAWVAEATAAPTATFVAASCFVLGLIALAAFAMGLSRRAPMVVFAGGALLDAAGCVFPPASLGSPLEVSRVAFRASLYLDSAFNACIGIALVGFAFMQPGPKWLRALCFVAGLASLPVALQFQYDAAAWFLRIAGPLWLAWVVATSVLLLRGRRHV